MHGAALLYCFLDFILSKGEGVQCVLYRDVGRQAGKTGQRKQGKKAAGSSDLSVLDQEMLSGQDEVERNNRVDKDQGN